MLFGDIAASNVSATTSCSFRSTLEETPIVHKAEAVYDVKQQNLAFLKTTVLVKAAVIMTDIYSIPENILYSVLKDARTVKFQNTSVLVSNRGDHTERRHHLLARGTNYSVSIQMKST